jgi:hypothetical protein
MINKVPDICKELYGSDLDSCSTQENEGCGRCSLYKYGYSEDTEESGETCE